MWNVIVIAYPFWSREPKFFTYSLIREWTPFLLTILLQKYYFQFSYCCETYQRIRYFTLNTFIFHFQSSQWTQCLLNVIANPDYEIVLRGVVIFTVSCLKYIYFLFFKIVLSHLNNLGRFVDKNIVSDHFSKNSELFSNKKN
jgi:hypothetical protein